jgi:Cu2+-exporting ATPase
MTCSGCKATVQKLLTGVAGVENVAIDLPNSEATIEMENHIPTNQLQSALKHHPKYQLDEKRSSQNGRSIHNHPLVKPAVVNNSDEQTGGSYYCPMHCEGDKVYDKPGNCPVCGMHLVKKDSKEIKEEASKQPVHKSSDGNKDKYYCPMHCEGDKVYDGAGNCPVCGMHLVNEDSKENKEIKVEASRQSVHKSSDGNKDKYYCPMHCEGDKVYDKPGKLPCVRNESGKSSYCAKEDAIHLSDAS